MTEFPFWLASELPGQARDPQLAAARLADAACLGRGGFALSSPAFANGEELDPSFTAYEEDAVAPPLAWTAPPVGTQELVLIVEAASATASAPPKCHWLVWGLAAQAGKLLEGEAPPRVGKNALGNSEWLLPAPPGGEPAHYVFQLFATDLPLVLMPGADREQLIAALSGRITACAVLHGTFTAASGEEDWGEDI